MPLKGLISEALNFINLLLTKSDKNKSIKGTVNVISVSSSALTERALIKI